MKLDALKKTALKAYKKSGGNFATRGLLPLKKPSDVGILYYPGVTAVVEKISAQPEAARTLCRSGKTIGLISTQPALYYPLLSAKAAIISDLSGANVIPLLIRYEHPENLPAVVRSIAGNFAAIIADSFKSSERKVLEAHTGMFETPLCFQEQLLAGAIMSLLPNAAKLLKKPLTKLSITLEGEGRMMLELIKQLKAEGLHALAIDERGALYPRRPNMNSKKIEMATMLRSVKDARSRAEILTATNVSISAKAGKLSGAGLPERCVIVALNADEVSALPKQTLVSTLPTELNHITDLHLALALAGVLMEGKKISDKTFSQGVKALTKLGKPDAKKLFPSLLEKGLSRKLAKLIK